MEGLPELYRLWFLFLALTGVRRSEAAGMRWDQGLIDTANGLIYTPSLPMVEQNVGYWACGGISVMDPEREDKVELRHCFASVVIAAGASFSETADYLGNPEEEVRRTYAHLVRERADEIRRAAGSIIHSQETRA